MNQLYPAAKELLKKISDNAVRIFGKSVIPEGEEMDFNAQFLTDTPNIKYANIKGTQNEDGTMGEDWSFPQVTLSLTNAEGKTHRALVPVNTDLLTLIENSQIDTEKMYGVKGVSKENAAKTRFYDRYEFQIDPVLAE